MGCFHFFLSSITTLSPTAQKHKNSMSLRFSSGTRREPIMVNNGNGPPWAGRGTVLRAGMSVERSELSLYLVGLAG